MKPELEEPTVIHVACLAGSESSGGFAYWICPNVVEQRPEVMPIFTGKSNAILLQEF